MSSNQAFQLNSSRKERIKEWIARPGGFGIIAGCVMFAMITLAGRNSHGYFEEQDRG